MITKRRCILGVIGVAALVSAPFGVFYLYKIVFVPHIFEGKVLRIVLDENGAPNTAAIIGALQSRFPAGTQSQEIIDYTTSQSGHCRWSDAEELHSCYFVIGGAMCVGTNVVMRFPEGKATQPIQVSFWTDGC